MKLKDAVRLARPRHWVKNVIVLFPVVFAMKVGDAEAWISAAVATLAMCLASSSVYIFNDICDRREDSLHPHKKDRPLAAGRVSVGAASALSAGFYICALVAAVVLVSLSGSLPTLMIFFAYCLLQLGYSTYLKKYMLVDVICIALGFVLRAVMGAAAIRVQISPWLFVCTFTICLFMGFCKRFNELVTIGDAAEATEHRGTLAGYSRELLTHLITLSAGVAIVGFLLYTTAGRPVAPFNTSHLLYTLPIVVYAVARFAMLSMAGRYPGPTELILRDRPLQLTLVLWGAAAVGVIFWGESLRQWVVGL